MEDVVMAKPSILVERLKGEKRYGLVHFSPRSNRHAIESVGLLTSCDLRQKGRIWLASRPGIKWALAHVCENHRVPVTDVDAFLVAFTDGRFYASREGIYYVKHDILPDAIARMDLDAMYLA
jgi:hypothetical protein